MLPTNLCVNYFISYHTSRPSSKVIQFGKYVACLQTGEMNFSGILAFFNMRYRY